MEAVLDAILARFEAQKTAELISEYHDDEPTSVARFPTAFVVEQGFTTAQYTVGSPGKIVLTHQMDIYYAVPLADGRPARRKLAAIAPLVMADWLQHRRLGGACRDMKVGGRDARAQSVVVEIAKIKHRALLLPLLIEVETTI